MHSANNQEAQLNYYDMIIDNISFCNLQKEEGWNVLINKDFNYEKEAKEKYISLGVLGNRKSGKSFILNKLTNLSLPNKYTTTKGISVKYKCEKNQIVIFDTAGFEKGKKVDDQKVISFIQKFILNYSHFVLVVVEKLGYAEQKLLMQIKNENKNKTIYVIHNLYQFEKINDIKIYINNTLLNSIIFNLLPTKYASFSTSSNEIKEDVGNQVYYCEESEKGKIEHLILGKEGSESGDYYNKNTLTYLRKNIIAVTFVKEVPLIDNIKNYISTLSNTIYNTKIPTNRIKYENGKLYIDNFNKNSCALLDTNLGKIDFNFYSASFKSLSKLQKMKFENEQYSIEDLQERTIYVLQVDLPGIKKEEYKPIFESSSHAINLQFKDKQFNNENISLMIETHPTETPESIINGYLGSIYEEGVYTFFFVVPEEELAEDEIEF